MTYSTKTMCVHVCVWEGVSVCVYFAGESVCIHAHACQMCVCVSERMCVCMREILRTCTRRPTDLGVRRAFFHVCLCVCVCVRLCVRKCENMRTHAYRPWRAAGPLRYTCIREPACSYHSNDATPDDTYVYVKLCMREYTCIHMHVYIYIRM